MTPQQHLGDTTVWDMAEECGVALGVVIHQGVGLGAWCTDGTVQADWAESLRQVLRSPHADRPMPRTPRPEKGGLETEAERPSTHSLAGALLDARAVTPDGVPLAEVARRLGVPPVTLDAGVAELAQAGLVERTSTSNICVPATKARQMRAVADGQLILNGAELLPR